MLTCSGRHRVLPAGLVAIVIAALASSFPHPAQAAAGDLPELTSISVAATDLAAPGEVVFAYSVSDGDGVVDELTVLYYDEMGRPLEATVKDMPASGVVRIPLQDGIRNGHYTLQQVVVLDDSPSAVRNWYRNGTVTEGDGSAGGAHGLDFAGQDLTITGSHEDFSPPVVTSASVSTADLTPGAELTARWTATEAHTLSTIRFTYYNPEGPDAVTLLSPAGADLSKGSLSKTLDPDVYNGVYTLTAIAVSDNLGNTATYFSDGRVTSRPTGIATGPTSHTLDFSASRFSVSGGTQDVSPPVLTRMSVLDRSLTAGENVVLDYIADDPSQPLDMVAFRFSGPDEEILHLQNVDDVSASGRLSTQTLGVGTYRLSQAALVDRHGNHVEYLRDGTTRSLSGGSASGRHSFDFSSLDLTITPSAPQILAARPKPRAVELVWDQSHLQLPGISSYRIEVNPGGRVISAPVNRQGEYPTQRYTVTGLVNNREYTFSIASQSSVGPGPARTVKARPMLSTNVFSNGDINHDKRSDVLAYRQGGTNWSLYAYRGTGRGGFATGATAVERYLTVAKVLPGDDLYRDGNADHLLLDQEGYLEVHGGDGSGGVGIRRTVGRGWGSMRFIDGGADFSGDGTSDILAVWPNGDLYLYRGKGDGLVRGGVKIGSGWASMLAVFTPGDFNGDRHADVLAVDPSGRLWLYKGNGRGGWSGKRELAGTGWAGFGAVVPLRDFSGDGRADLGAVTMSGDLYLYRGNGTGRFTTRSLVGRGWHIYF